MRDKRCQHCGLPYRTLAGVCEHCGSTSPEGETQHEFQQVYDHEWRRTSPESAVKHPGWLSAFWFGCVTCIPGLIVLGFAIKGGESEVLLSAIILILGPAAIASLYGARLGPGILESDDITTGFRSFQRGALIAFAIFITFSPLAILILTVIGPYASQNRTKLLELFFFVMFWGFVLVGWWGVLIGGLAGWLLYKLFR